MGDGHYTSRGWGDSRVGMVIILEEGGGEGLIHKKNMPMVI